VQAGGHAGRNAVEAVQAGDFLDKVDFTDEILAEGRRLPGGFAVAVWSEFYAAKHGKLVFYNVKGKVDAE
jgi:hypothetical protein